MPDPWPVVYVGGTIVILDLVLIGVLASWLWFITVSVRSTASQTAADSTPPGPSEPAPNPTSERSLSTTP